MRPTPDDYAEARRLLATAVFERTAADGLTPGRYEHDHDEELECYWFNDPPPNPAPNTRNVAGATKAFDRPRPRRDEAYWDGTARLVLDYFELQAGALYSETLEEGFVAWLQRSPGERRQYEESDDMKRAALVDWFLRVVR
jgi:hypothetical protein